MTSVGRDDSCSRGSFERTPDVKSEMRVSDFEYDGEIVCRVPGAESV